MIRSSVPLRSKTILFSRAPRPILGPSGSRRLRNVFLGCGVSLLGAAARRVTWRLCLIFKDSNVLSWEVSSRNDDTKMSVWIPQHRGVYEEVAACQQGLHGTASVDAGHGRTSLHDRHPRVPQDVHVAPLEMAGLTGRYTRVGILILATPR